MAENIATGLEVLAAERFSRLTGRKVGLITNPTGVLRNRQVNIEAMRAAGVKLVALYGPEHGVRGDAPAGAYVPSRKDKRTGLPAFSLYGPTKVPTAAMLKGVDILVFDIQDIGARSYTYLSTLGCALEGAAKHGVPAMVLDRPNPSGLLRIEGGPPRPGYFSFVGRYPTAYLHGLTLGEAAKMISGAGWIPGGKSADLTVVPCSGLTRKERNGFLPWDETGLPWVPTSPNVRSPRTALFYAVTGIVGELPVCSLGLGTADAFAVYGRPGLDSTAYAKAVNKELALLPAVGIAASAHTFTPTKGVFAGKRCSGVRLTIDNPINGILTYPNFALMTALRSLGVTVRISGDSGRLFNLSCGTNAVQKAFTAGGNAKDLWEIYHSGADNFAALRHPYLLY
jgi:uncharacterized protein YbbC (DUF1343 family)